MKKLVDVDEKEEGLMKLIGENVILFCVNYSYAGKLIGVSETCVLLADACKVYETGPLIDDKWKDSQPLPNSWYVRLSSVESFGVSGR
jgi:hypothetical protein